MEPAPEGASPTSLDVLSFLDTLVNSTEEQCFSARSRSTVLEGLPFGGVPTVLAINFILWLVSVPGGCHFMVPQSLWCQRLAVSMGVCVLWVHLKPHARAACALVHLTDWGNRSYVQGTKSFAHILVGSKWHWGSSCEIRDWSSLA